MASIGFLIYETKDVTIANLNKYIELLEKKQGA